MVDEAGDLLRTAARRAVARVSAERGSLDAVAPPQGLYAGLAGPAPHAPDSQGSRTSIRRGRPLVSSSCLERPRADRALQFSSDALWTPLAREDAYLRGDVRAVVHGDEFSIAVGSDHGGRDLRAELLESLRELGWRPRDLGSHEPGASDYPDSAHAVAEEVASGRVRLGVVVDAMGTGSAIAANKVPGVRAANAWDEASAKSAREHNHANVLALGAAHLERAAAHRILAAFLSAEPGPGRHARRVARIGELETRYGRPGGRRS